MKFHGVVKSYRSRNGCGFISREGMTDVFVHVSNILDNDGDPADILIPGESVEYELVQGRRGPAALRVRRLNPLRLHPQKGKVKRLFNDKGYGFIESSEGDVFFHVADVLTRDVVPGDLVEYLSTLVKGKPRAFRVRRYTDNGS